MKTVMVQFMVDIEDNAIENLKKAVTHHLDYLLDLDSWQEIKSVHDGILYKDIETVDYKIGENIHG